MTDTGRFGPQTAEIETLLARVLAMTLEEAALAVVSWDAAAWDAAWYAGRRAARVANRRVARHVVWDVMQAVARDAARDTPWHAVRDAPWYGVRDAVWDATLALLVRDLIAPDSAWDQTAYNMLTAPLASVIGRIHPDDKEIAK